MYAAGVGCCVMELGIFLGGGFFHSRIIAPWRLISLLAAHLVICVRCETQAVLFFHRRCLSYAGIGVFLLSAHFIFGLFQNLILCFLQVLESFIR